MWPKLIAQLFENYSPTSPVSVPMADRYFSTGNASGKKPPKPLWSPVAEGVRGDLGQVTKAHAGLYRLSPGARR